MQGHAGVLAERALHQGAGTTGVSRRQRRGLRRLGGLQEARQVRRQGRRLRRAARCDLSGVGGLQEHRELPRVSGQLREPDHGDSQLLSCRLREGRPLCRQRRRVPRGVALALRGVARACAAPAESLCKVRALPDRERSLYARLGRRLPGFVPLQRSLAVPFAGWGVRRLGRGLQEVARLRGTRPVRCHRGALRGAQRHGLPAVRALQGGRRLHAEPRHVPRRHAGGLRHIIRLCGREALHAPRGNVRGAPGK
jgi:hypothetical protein